MNKKGEFEEEEHARIYSSFRPDIPSEIAEKCVSYLKEKYLGPLERAVDVGCGSGQSSRMLAPFFDRVYGFDTSGVQIAEARASRQPPNVEYAVSVAETLPVPSNSVQLVTAGASLHWFDTRTFFREVRRVLAPEGVFVTYTYHKVCPVTEGAEMTKEVDRLYKEVYQTLEPYWADEVFESFQKYENISFPFEEVRRFPDLRQILSGTLSDIVGFIESFSAYRNLKRQEGRKAEDLIKHFSTKMLEILQLTDDYRIRPIELYRDIFIIMCRKGEL